MDLKQRLRDPNYLFIKTDFLLLSDKQKYYASYFLNHAIFPVLQYSKAVDKIKKGWENRNEQAGQSMAKDLEGLALAYSGVKLQEESQRWEINYMFERIYALFNEMWNDHVTSYLSDTQFAEYLTEYQNAIETNKKLCLISWKKEPAITNIERKIAEMLNKKSGC